MKCAAKWLWVNFFDPKGWVELKDASIWISFWQDEGKLTLKVAAGSVAVGAMLAVVKNAVL